MDRVGARAATTGAPLVYAPVDFEIHGAEIKSPWPSKAALRANPNTVLSPWTAFGYGFRLDVLRGAYPAIGAYGWINEANPLALFGAVVERHYPDRRQRAYEEILHRFDEMLSRRYRETGERQRGVVIHDESGNRSVPGPS